VIAVLDMKHFSSLPRAPWGIIVSSFCDLTLSVVRTLTRPAEFDFLGFIFRTADFS
jgi:hypothetical protein